MKAIYSGTFDPLTVGHLEVIERSSKMFSSVIVAVAENKSKNPMFSLSDRIKMASDATSHLENVNVLGFNNLMVDFAKENEVEILIRGIRTGIDFEYEMQMSLANSFIDHNIQTVYLTPSLKNIFVSSTMIRELLKFDGDVSKLVPEAVLKYIKK